MERRATRDAYGEALVEIGERHPEVVVLDADLAESTRSHRFAERFPDRFFDVGVAEQDMILLAAGLALAGKKPFASTFAVFAACRAYDQIRVSVAIPGLDVKIVASHGGLSVGEDGATHQSIEDLALMRVIPGMTVLVPADYWSAYRLALALAEHRGPAYLRLGRPKVPVIYGPDEEFRIGDAKLLRGGRDVTIIACGHMVFQALRAAEALAERGVEAEVLDVYSIKPLPSSVISYSLKKTGCGVVVEEHSVVGGLGGAVAELSSCCCPVPIKRVGVADRYGQSGGVEELWELYGLTPEKIADAALEVLHRKRGF